MPAYLNGVQGLRTVAALMVAVYHIWFGRVSGAVDVFFVVAGYFAAKSLMRMAESETFRARVQVMSRYWMRTLRRITPSAVVVIIGTAVASLLFMPHSAWQYAIPHGFASLFHFENWLLIASNADYLQDGMAASPFQQFWALSLQAQFYLLFPLLLFVAVSLAKRRGWGARGRRSRCSR
ncbi:acyltransferase family protein [Leucobacter soli]|uniref:acyltransferase family protein n=1 Tax=Leucobacter soli TaxID=2812850 RepID=UPI00362130DC